MACAETARLQKVGAFLLSHITVEMERRADSAGITGIPGSVNVAYGMAGCKRGSEKMVRAEPTAGRSKLLPMREDRTERQMLLFPA